MARGRSRAAASASPVKSPPEFLIEFTLHNACVTYFDDGFSRFRSSFFSRTSPLEAMVHGFTEYTEGYQRLTTLPRGDGDAGGGLQDGRVDRDQAAVQRHRRRGARAHGGDEGGRSPHLEHRHACISSLR